MGRRFGKIQQLPSGNHRASFMGPDGVRVFAPMTFPTEEDADTWLAPWSWSPPTAAYGSASSPP